MDLVVTATRTAEIHLRTDGIVSVFILSKVLQTLDDARENLDTAVLVRGGVRCPIVIDLTKCEPLIPEVRHHYSGSKLGDAFHALALIVPASSFGRIMGNIYLRIASPGVPIRLFDSHEEAISWLRNFKE